MSDDTEIHGRRVNFEEPDEDEEPILVPELSVWWDEPQPIGVLLDQHGATLTVVMPERFPIGFQPRGH